MEKITTGDIYESVYYVLNGCELNSIEGILVNGKISCQLKFTGPQITQLQLEYFQGKAKVNLFDFRQTYSQVNSWIVNAKKQIKHELTMKKQNPSSKGGGA